MNKASKPKTHKPIRFIIVRGLNACCNAVDLVAYRPFAVKAIEWSPVFWRCQLANLSIKLDNKWKTAYWDSEIPETPLDLCDACQRRASWLCVGGTDKDEDLEWDFDGDDADYLYFSKHPVNLCSYCELNDEGSPPQNSTELKQLLNEARFRSVSWRWK